MIRASFLFAFNVLIALAMVGFGPPKMVDREVSPSIRLNTSELQQWYVASRPPKISADALLVYDVESGRTLYSRNA